MKKMLFLLLLSSITTSSVFAVSGIPGFPGLSSIVLKYGKIAFDKSGKQKMITKKQYVVSSEELKGIAAKVLENSESLEKLARLAKQTESNSPKININIMESIIKRMSPPVNTNLQSFLEKGDQDLFIFSKKAPGGGFASINLKGSKAKEAKALFTFKDSKAKEEVTALFSFLNKKKKK